MGRPSNEDRRDTRREILEAALDLFAERGYHATSMRTLATAVGVRESAIYHHYDSKEALLHAVLDDLEQGRSALLDAEVAAVEECTLEETLTQVTARLVEALAEPRARKLVRFLVVAGPALSADEGGPWRAVIERGRKLMLQLFQKLRRAGKLRDDLEFELFLSHVAGPILIAMSGPWAEGKGPMTLPARRFAREHVAFLVRAMAPGKVRG